jgi:hypothetical protein
MIEFDALTSEQKEAVEKAIKLARQTNGPASIDLADGAEAYAVPVTDGGLAWGINASPNTPEGFEWPGQCIARGVREASHD